MKKFFAIISAVVLVVSTNSTAVASVNGLSPKGKKTYALNVCETQQQLDCLEPVEYFDGQNFVPAEYLGFEKAGESFVEPSGNTIEMGRTIWQTQTAGKTSKFFIHARLATQDSVIAKINGITKTGSELFVIVDGPDDDLTTKLQIKVRTSWVKPENVTLHAWEPSFKSETITGGTRWIFQGIQVKTLGYSGDHQNKMKTGAKADFEMALLDFHVHHAGVDVNSSFFDPKCAKAGYTIESSNAGSGGRPVWNSQTKSVDFAIQAPHQDSAGNLNRGFFYLWVTRAYMKCAWPNSGLDRANQFTVSVVNEDGTKQVATTLVTYKNNLLKVSALNFHYSSPTIKLAPKKVTKKKK